MDRYETITRITPGTTVPLSQVARLLVQFIDECSIEDMDPQACPAVMALGAMLAFHCHADLDSPGYITRLMQRCAEKAAEREVQRRSAH